MWDVLINKRSLSLAAAAIIRRTILKKLQLTPNTKHEESLTLNCLHDFLSFAVEKDEAHFLRFVRKLKEVCGMRVAVYAHAFTVYTASMPRDSVLFCEAHYDIKHGRSVMSPRARRHERDFEAFHRDAPDTCRRKRKKTAPSHVMTREPPT